jgi:lipopolysaccharide biosynthesis glycosyltransferase
VSVLRSVVFALDQNYVVPFKVAFHGLSTRGRLLPDTRFFVLFEAKRLPQNVREDICQFANRYGVDVSLVDCTGRLPANLPLLATDHVSEATFYRLFIASLLPPEVGSVLYLDLDIAVLGDLQFLMELSLTQPVAAVDHCFPAPFRLMGDQPAPYFNAGIAIFDLQHFRHESCESRFIEILRSEAYRLTWWDQDVLNLAFKDCWQRLPVWYNITNAARGFVPHESVPVAGKIVHFDGSSKPWHRHCIHPWKDLWLAQYEDCFGVPLRFPEDAREASHHRPLIRRIAGRALRALRFRTF